MDGNHPLLGYLPCPADPSRPYAPSAAHADGVVVVYFSRLGGAMYTHERITLSVVAEAIAQIKGVKFAGLYDNAKSDSGNVFFVPDDTLVLDEASRLGVRSPTDLFGAVVPYPFAKTKAITHQLIDPSADRPEGWSSAYAEMVQDVVLPGYTAFSVGDGSKGGGASPRRRPETIRRSGSVVAVRRCQHG
jgi:hypothetical protein